MARALTEGELIALASDGDGDAYASLVRAHQDVAFRTAMLITQNAAEAEEAAQDALRQRVARAAAFPGGRAVAAVAADDRRQRGAQPPPLGGPPGRAGVAGAGGRASDRSAEAAVIAGESRAALLAAMSRLRDDDRLVLGCRYLLELSEAETAAALGVKQGTVKSRTSRALGRLRGEVTG